MDVEKFVRVLVLILFCVLWKIRSFTMTEVPVGSREARKIMYVHFGYTERGYISDLRH